MNAVYVQAAYRTPIGRYQGMLSELSAPQLGAAVLRQLVRVKSSADLNIAEILMGCVLTAGIGQAPARQAALLAGLPDSVPCTTINKVCGSGMKAVMLACDQLRLGNGAALGEGYSIIAGGMESMSQAPELLEQDCTDMTQSALKSHLFWDGLTDAGSGLSMGEIGEQHIDKQVISRAELDEYASLSLSRAQLFSSTNTPEIVSLKLNGGQMVDQDELPLRVSVTAIPKLTSCFGKNGKLTAATTSAISDGAAGLLLSSDDSNRTALAKVMGYVSYAGAANDYPSAPAYAIEQLLNDLCWTVESVDLYEINEAFASVPIFAARYLGLDISKVNVTGGACAIGHPIGASGARIVVSLIHALRTKKLKRGIAAICIGGGEATAIAVEVVNNEA